MTTIIAGRFDEQDAVATAAGALRAAGFPAEHISTFYVAPAGQHARYPMGGDHDKSPGAEETPKGTAADTTTGGVIGAALGAVSSPLTGPIGAITGGLVGAHIGNLVGALGMMKDEDATTDSPSVRHAGMMIAVCTPTEHCRQRAIKVLSDLGAHAIESGNGRIVNGDWMDFDPSVPPHLIEQHPGGRASA